MRKTRKRQLLAVYKLITGKRPHLGAQTWWGYAPSRQRQLKRGFLALRRRGVPVRRAMTDASMGKS